MFIFRQLLPHGKRPCCIFWWCPPKDTAWLKAAFLLPWCCRSRPAPKPADRRIFDDCPESRLPVVEADLVVSATVERLLQDGAQVSARVRRALKGPRELGGSVLLVEGLDNEALCGTRLAQGDTHLFLLKGGASEGRTRLLSSPLRLTLANLDRLQAAVKVPCEAKYCPFNGDCSEDRLGGARCSCPTSCWIRVGARVRPRRRLVPEPLQDARGLVSQAEEALGAAPRTLQPHHPGTRVAILVRLTAQWCGAHGLRTYEREAEHKIAFLLSISLVYTRGIVIHSFVYKS
ncbi:hypothetical protein HPB48_019238 [Haemaphysalis longicornis]|uniref:NtA domain-containing protein n=1 Tax=Haemaphysalis longicornis TaxID=44386 RepID=A0A9J6GQN4_HAELO|nr:hypothetical protein HPB48_019238 [Haemaphysalis longicornis]